MEITDYKYIQHNIKTRPWGVECQFTAINSAGKYFDDIVMISSEKAEEKELVEAITERLKQTDIVREELPTEKIYTEKEVESLLVSKGYLVIGEKVESLKTLDTLVAESALVEGTIK